MVLYFLLIILFGIIVLASIAVLIYGLVKKKRKALVVALIFCIFGVVGCIVSAYAYTRKMVDYVTSDAFQEDARKGSALVGETLGSVSSGVSEGLAITLDEKAIAELAGKSSAIMSQSIKTMASAFDSTIGNTPVFIDQNLADAGFEFGRAEEYYHDQANDLGVFIDYKKDFKGKLKITGYDQTGKKIDVAEKT